MANAQNSVVINRPANMVYDFFADGLNNPKWRPGVVSITLASGTGGQIGAVYRQQLKAPGPGHKTIPGDYSIITAVPYKQLGFEVIAGPAKPSGNFTFETTPEGTKVTFTLSYTPHGWKRLINPLIQRTMVHEVTQLNTAKHLLDPPKPAKQEPDMPSVTAG